MALGPDAAAAIADLSHTVQATRACVDVDLDATIEGDPAQIHRLFLNLIGKAYGTGHNGHQPRLPRDLGVELFCPSAAPNCPM